MDESLGRLGNRRDPKHVLYVTQTPCEDCGIF